MTPTQYVKILKPYICGKKDSWVMPDETFNELNKAYQTFTPTQQTFCAMAISTSKAEKAVKQQKRKQRWFE